MKSLLVRDNSGVYAASRRMVRWLPLTGPPSGLRMVQFCHGHGATAITFNSLGKVFQTLWDSGRYLPYSADQGGTAGFASDAVLTDVQAADQYMIDKYGARSDKKAFVGYSMGFLNYTREVIANPTKVAVAIGVAPFTDGAHCYADNASVQSDMDTAAGGSWASVNSARSPASNSVSFASTRVECWQGTSDTTVRPADTSAFCTAVGGTYHAVAGDHGTVWLNIAAADILAALDAGAW